MKYDFDQIIERRSSDSTKWNHYDEDVLPMWVADMDFVCPEPILEALQQRVSHGVFGYGQPDPQLTEVICERMTERYNWQVTTDQILFLPSLVCGLNLVCRAVGRPGDDVLVQTPVYPPFLSAPANQGRRLISVELKLTCEGDNLIYSIDYASFEAAITKRTSLFMLCHPHNPIGRLYDAEELLTLAEICASHGVIICSDEIHCDLMLDGGPHKPMASLSPEIAERCITLMSPSKTFNIPGLGVGFAIIQNPALLRRMKRAAQGIVAHVNLLGFVAAITAYRDCEDWLRELCEYLRDNRDYLLNYVEQNLCGIRTTLPRATYLAWLDCREAGIAGNPYDFFLEEARVAFNDGKTFGAGGEGFVRLNFGCPRYLLGQGLERMKLSL